jgi:HEAT repeat protein
VSSLPIGIPVSALFYEIEIPLKDMRFGDAKRLINAVPMLAQFGEAAVRWLLGILQSGLPLVRDYSAWGLGLIGRRAEAAIPALCLATRDPNASVRYAAIVALGGIAKATAEVVSALDAV